MSEAISRRSVHSSRRHSPTVTKVHFLLQVMIHMFITDDIFFLRDDLCFGKKDNLEFYFLMLYCYKHGHLFLKNMLASLRKLLGTHGDSHYCIHTEI